MRPLRSWSLPLALGFLAIALGVYWRAPVAVEAQTQRLVTFPTVTLTGSLQQLATTGQTCTVVQFYAPGAGSTQVAANTAGLIVGDANISATGTGRGIALVPGAARSIPAISTAAYSTVSLSTLYVLGTSGDHLQFDCWN